MTRRHGAAVALIVALAAGSGAMGGCSDARSGSLGPAPSAPAPSAPAPSAPAPAGTASSVPAGSGGATITIALWFVRGGALAPTRRTRPATVATSRLALTELAAGPSPAEAVATLTSAVPAGTGFEISAIANGVETVRFDPAFYAGDPATVRLRRAQVVYTLTQFPTVAKVAFRSGAAQPGGPSGGQAAEPAGRAAYADLLPPIVVTSPAIGQEVSSPLTVAGTAQVFEATVNVRVLDAAGHEIATGFTVATCGTGCRGDFSVAIRYRLQEPAPGSAPGSGSGSVEVYEISPRDGTRVSQVTVPVLLESGTP